MAGEADLPPQNSDHHINNDHHTISSDSADGDFTISQLIRSKNFHSTPTPPSRPSSLGKRRKSTPVRYDDYTVTSGRTIPRHNAVVQDGSSKSPSSQKGKLATTHVSSPALIKAEEVQLSLGAQYPICIKMVKANVETLYWMGFPQWFGRVYLPQTDCEVAIEDENGEIHCVKYIAEKKGLSAGWKKFADTNNLLEGDVLVFQLVEPHKFKVYIIRADGQSKVDGALSSVSNTEAHTAQMVPETGTPFGKKTKRPKPLSQTTFQKKHNKSSGNNRDENGSKVLGDPKPNLPSQELKSFKDFHILVNGVSIDSELPEKVRMSYFKLCKDRKELLHDGVRPDIYLKLVAGVIPEIVNIADKIKKCKLTTTKEEFEAWDNSLRAFALLGMKVGFLRDRIVTLSRHVFESDGRVDIERYMQAKKEQERVKDEITRVTEELKKLKESSRKFQGEVDGLKEKVEKLEAKFQEEVNVPW